MASALKMKPARLSISEGGHRYGGDLNTPTSAPWTPKGPFDLPLSLPGPTSYHPDDDSSFGRQVKSHRKSEANVVIGVGRRDKEEAPRSPGPMYSPKEGATRPRSPVAKFGTNLRSTRLAPPAHGSPDRPESRGIPGVGDYGLSRRVLPASYLNTLASRGTFGQQRKSAFHKMYPGKSMDKLSANVREAQNDALAPPMSSLGPQSTRPTSPAFSFAPGGSAERILRRPRTSVSVPRNVSEAAAQLHSRRARTTRSGRRKKNYDWLYAGQGVALSSSRTSQQKRSGSSFSKSRRFENVAYNPLKVCGVSLETPGPKYDTRGDFGNGPKLSFPRVEGREDIHTKYMRRQKRPGPADYNLRLEHSLERYLEELHSEQTRALQFFATESEVQSFFTRSTNTTEKSGKTKISLNSMSTFAIASELGVYKAGYPPNRPKSPAWKFPTIGRDATKSYVSDALSKDRKGLESPGPATAHPELFSPNVSRPNSPAFTFGNRRDPLEKPNNDVGPAGYGWTLEEALGHQRMSTRPSAPRHSFLRGLKGDV